MKRFAAHYIFLGEEKIYKQHYLELDENNCISGIFPLENEIAGTVFHNGVLFPVSTTLNLQPEVAKALKDLSQQYPEDSIFQLLQSSGLVCEDQNIPVRIFRLDGIDLLLLKFLKNRVPCIRKI